MRVHYLSTRGSSPPVSFQKAVFRGIAPDGGLYLPDHIPVLARESIFDLTGRSLPDIGARLLAEFVAPDLEGSAFEGIVREAFDFPVPLIRLEEDLYVAELFHGPSLAFKDFGARFMARAMAALRVPPGEGVDGSGDGDLTILTATSGDTGGAVAKAFQGVPGIRVLVLFPEGRVSPRQEAQFATLGGNITAVGVAGRFDDCQRMVKEALAIGGREGGSITSANSINVSRLLPQTVYYAKAWAELASVTQGRPSGSRPVFLVPSGNFGNLSAGLIALRMGLPVEGFVAATNANSVVPEFLQGGPLRPRPSVDTVSSAMDVGNPSNVERLLMLAGGGREGLARWVAGSAHTDEETLEAIAGAWREHGYLADPHTAVGLAAAARLGGRWSGHPRIVLATAHPAKFPEAIMRATGVESALPESLQRDLSGRREVVSIPAETDALLELV
jgi:threonine synthase